MTSLTVEMERVIEGTIEKADTYCKEKRYKEADEIYTILLNGMRLDQENLLPNGKKKLALVYNNRGHSRYMQVYFEEAFQDYSYAVFLDPKLAVAYYNRGMVTYRLCAAMPQEGGKRKAMCNQAEGDIAEAVRLEPGNIVFKEALDNCVDVPGGMTGSSY